MVLLVVVVIVVGVWLVFAYFLNPMSFMEGLDYDKTRYDIFL